jgi:hypothetical protein
MTEHEHSPLAIETDSNNLSLPKDACLEIGYQRDL